MKPSAPSKSVLPAIALLCVMTPLFGCGSAAPQSSEGVTVKEVIDGDTIVVTSNGETERVRLIGVDTPETVHPTKPVECYGKEASEFTKAQLPAGTRVELKRDVEPRDRYGRVLAYAFRSSDGMFVNLELVYRGYAKAYRFPPNVALSAQFSQAQNHARSAGLGMWSKCQGG